MAFRAEWRRLPNDPSHLLGWCVRILRGPPRITERIDALLPVPSPEVAFWVRIAVSANGLAKGTDHGYLTFADGWLLFEGLRTNFALKESDVETMKRSLSVVRRLEDVGWRLELVDGTHVRIDPMGVTPTARSLSDALVLWRTARSSKGESILPPTRALPEVVAASILRLVAGSLLATLGIVLLGQPPVGNVLLSLVLLFGGVLVVGRAFATLGELRRIGY